MSVHQTVREPAGEQPRHFGLLARFDTAEALLGAARAVRAAGYTCWDAHTPFPLHQLDEAMGTRRTRLPWIVLCMGLTGTSLALFMVWWTNATSFPGTPAFLRGYDYIISGKPIFSLPANIPVLFELTVLLSAFGAVFGMLLLNGLPRLYNPLFKTRMFQQVTTDRFFISIRAEDPRYDRARTEQLLRSLGASAIEDVED